MSKIKTFPTLYKKDKNGKIREWKIIANDKGFYETIHGQSEGKMQSDKRSVEQKNVGRSNETTLFEQAKAEALSKWKKQKDIGYVENLNDVKEGNSTLFQPMKAHNFDPSKINFNSGNYYYIQRKYDGVRAFIEKNQILSYKRKVFHFLDHILSEAVKLVNKYGIILDGELHAEGAFEKIISMCRRTVNPPPLEDSLKVYLRVYDIKVKNNPEMPFEDRLVFLRKLFHENKLKYIKYSPTHKVKSFEQLDYLHDKFVKEKLTKKDGAIIRFRNGKYECCRSWGVMKYKKFTEEEYPIADIIEGEGREKGLAIFVCKMIDGRTFKARSEGSAAYRSEIFRNKKKYIGKEVTIKYFELTNKGIPRFPVGKAIRDYE